MTWNYLDNFFRDWSNGDFVFDGEFTFELVPEKPEEPEEPEETEETEESEETEETEEPEKPEKPKVNWSHGCEIGEAIKSKPDSGFGKDGGLVDMTELLNRLAVHTEPRILNLLERYEADYEWWNDYDFIVRYFVSSFVNQYEDLSADSLKSILDFVGVDPVDDTVIQQVVDQYSQDGTHHFTYLE